MSSKLIAEKLLSILNKGYEENFFNLIFFSLEEEGTVKAD